MIQKELQQIIQEITTTGRTLKESTRRPAPRRLRETHTAPASRTKRRLMEAAQLQFPYRGTDSQGSKRAKLLMNFITSFDQEDFYTYEDPNAQQAKEYAKQKEALQQQVMRLPNGKKLIDMVINIWRKTAQQQQRLKEPTPEMKKLRDAAGIDNQTWVILSTDEYTYYEPYGRRLSSDNQDDRPW